MLSALSVLIGYLRCIVNEKGHIPLNNYRFTGALNLVIRGLIDGTKDLCSLHFSKNCISSLMIYIGSILFIIVLYI